MTSNEIRQIWTSFFINKGHLHIPGHSLVPDNDPTLLWINAGVAALKKYFNGSETPPSKRLTNIQKCIRTNDIENVGDSTHLTFFEMLGNFSIGDYFRTEAITWAWELLTSPKYFNLPKEKLYITYHPDDLETKKIWMDVGVDESHLIIKEDNFWEIGEGPCGPDTEIHFDRGEKYDPEDIGIKLLEDDLPNSRFVEIWNIVFSQYNSVAGKKRSEYEELPNKNIDTGAGLERFATILQDKETCFETDLFWPIIESIEKITGKKYEDNKRAFRVIADHMRAVTFALSEGVMCSNEGRNYVVRRLLRRAIRYGKNLGMTEPFLYQLVSAVTDNFKDWYNGFDTGYLEYLVKKEEDKFTKVLSMGEKQLEKIIKHNGRVDGKDIFKLSDTFGFPKELTMEICEEKGIDFDLNGFDELMEEQRNKAKVYREQK